MSDLTLSDIEVKLAGLKRSTWKPIVQVGESLVDGSKTSGKVRLAPGETWPTCPNCCKPMRLVLQLNLQELPSPLNQQFGEGLLQLFCCESDFEIHTGEYIPERLISTVSKSALIARINDADQTVIETFESDYEETKEVVIERTLPCSMWACEAFSNAQITRIIQLDKGSLDVLMPVMEDEFPEKQIVGWQESEEYPHREELASFGVALEDQEIEFLDQSGLFAQVGDKLGGWVCWAQAIEYPSCPICGQAMNQLVFQLESDPNASFPYPHGGLGVGYLVQCPEHREQVTFFCQFT
jgi:hypothetical protein